MPKQSTKSYITGLHGLTQDYDKALELYHRQESLVMLDLKGVEKDKKRATHYYELAAMMGDAKARYNLGNVGIREGNIDRALRRN